MQRSDRYSEDLDFTAINLSKPSFEDALKEITAIAEEQINLIEPCKPLLRDM